MEQSATLGVAANQMEKNMDNDMEIGSVGLFQVW